ncbi:MAG: rhomboid family intramembrane serine protease [Anaerolineae bacterium]
MSHLLHDNPDSQPKRGGHPLSDRPPEPEQEKGVSIPIPLSANVPFLTYALIVLNVGIFALRYLVPELSNQILQAGYADADAILRGRELYRLFTAMFLHLNEAHILFNGLALYYIGSNLERLFGHVRFGIVYLLGGLTGSVLPLFFSSGGLGASGAVFAIWGAEAVFLYQHRAIFGAMGRARLQNSLMLMLVNFLAGFSANALANVADSNVRIGNAAHLGGLIGGAVLAWLIGPHFTVRRKAVIGEDGVPIEVVQNRPLTDRLHLVLYVAVGLLALLLMAIFLRT